MSFVYQWHVCSWDYYQKPPMVFIMHNKIWRWLPHFFNCWTGGQEALRIADRDGQPLSLFTSGPCCCLCQDEHQRPPKSHWEGCRSVKVMVIYRMELCLRNMISREKKEEKGDSWSRGLIHSTALWLKSVDMIFLCHLLSFNNFTNVYKNHISILAE